MVNGQAQETDERIQLFSLTGSDHWYDIENTEVIAYRHKQLEDAHSELQQTEAPKVREDTN